MTKIIHAETLICTIFIRVIIALKRISEQVLVAKMTEMGESSNQSISNQSDQHGIDQHHIWQLNRSFQQLVRAVQTVTTSLEQLILVEAEKNTQGREREMVKRRHISSVLQLLFGFERRALEINLHLGMQKKDEDEERLAIW